MDIILYANKTYRNNTCTKDKIEYKDNNKIDFKYKIELILYCTCTDRININHNKFKFRNKV